MKNIIKKISTLFEDKRRRTIYILLFILPFLILIIIFGINIYKEAKNLIGLATNETSVNNKFIIKDGQYKLRDNATDLQKDLFAQLKDMLEGNIESTKEGIAGSICQNFIADFYTWTNKTGQYDVGGTYYIYDDATSAFYTQARDEFYKYLNDYIDSYGSSNLLEVETVNVISSKLASEAYVFPYEAVNDDGETYWTGTEYETYDVTCEWTYKANEKFDTSKYVKKQKFKVIIVDDKYVIAEVDN